ncbi:MAG: hypothetical protein M3Q07_22230 [Pseudobdellovibrionaceae bacterium]|nr:hypothetical protein [Pseudobdellovibrionaceae bacterium]
MQTYRVTAAAIDEVQTTIEARSPHRAALKLLSLKKANEFFDSEESFEVVVENEKGRKFIFAASLVSSFRLQKVG